MIESYDSIEEMIAAERAAQDAARKLVTPGQRALAPGDLWLRPLPEWELVIFGEVHEDAGDFVFGRAYSEACPEGELGDTHRSTVVKISPEQFGEARDNRWDWRSLPWVREVLVSALAEHRERLFHPTQEEKEDDDDDPAGG